MKLKLHLSKVNRFYEFLAARFAEFKPIKEELYQAAFDHIHYGGNKLDKYLRELSGATTARELLDILNGNRKPVSPVSKENDTVPTGDKD